MNAVIDVIKSAPKDVDNVTSAVSSLSKEFLGNALAASELSNKQKEKILTDRHLTDAEIEVALATKTLSGAQTKAAAATSGFKLALSGLWATLKPFLGIAAVAAAIGFVVHKLDESIVTANEQAEANKELKTSYDELATELDQVASRIDTVKDRIEELEGLGTLSITEQDELERLRQENKELEHRKTLLEADTEKASGELTQGIDDWWKKEFQKGSYKNITQNPDGEGFKDQTTGSIYTEGVNAYATKEEQLKAQIERGKELIALGDKRTLQEEEELKRIREATTATANELATKIEGYKAVTEEQIKQKELWESYIADSAYIRDPGKYQNKKFDEIWNSASFLKYKGKISKAAKADRLDVEPSIIKGLEILADGVGVSTEEIKQHIRSLFDDLPKIMSTKPLSKTNMISSINDLSEGFEALDKIMESQKNDDTFDYALFDDQSFKENFADLGSAYTDFVEIISENPKDIKACQKAYNSLVTEWIYSEKVLGGISEETANVTEAMLKNMGVANAAEVVDNALIRRKAELAWESRESTNAIADEVIALNGEADALSDTEMAWSAYIAQKLLDEVYNGNGDILQLKNVMQALGLGVQAWETYAKAKAKASYATGYWEYTEGDDGVTKTWVSAEENRAGWYALADYSYEQMNAQIEQLIREATTDINYAGSPKTKDSDGSDTDNESEIDWIQRKNEILQRLHDEQLALADDETNSYNERIEALKELIEKDKERAEIARQSANKYNEAWEEAASKLDGKDRERIENGSLEIIDYTEAGYDDEYVNNLQKAQELYDQKVEAETNANEIEKDSLEHRRKEVQLLGEIIAAQQEVLDNEKATLEAKIEMAEVTGKYVGAGSYKDLIENSKAMESSLRDQIDNLEAQIDLVDEDSAEYNSLKASIANCEQSIMDCQIQQAEWNETIERLPVERIQTYITLLQHTIEDFDNFLAQQSQVGLNPNKDQYQTYIDLYTDQIAELLKKQEKLVEIQSKYEYGSEKYKEYADEIQGIDNEISGLIEKQLEYNDAILKIPVNKMQEQYDNIAGVREALDREIAEDNAKGLQTTIQQYQQLNGLTVQQLQLLSAQRQALVGLLSVYDENSEKYKEVQDQIAGIDSTMSSLVQEQYSWNAEILNMPIDKLDKANENLSNYSSILGEVLSDYDSALKGVNALIDGQIDGIQSQLDLLSKSNEARKIQLSLEQALYNLRRAEEQKNIQVVRNGRIEYESNADDIRSAQQELADAQYDKMVYDLEQQIEKLEDIKQNWADIIEQIERAKDLQSAEDLFGEGWQDSVLSDSDSLRNVFKSLYEITSAEKESVDKQIESNERISSMMGEFITRYQEGSLTYEQALTNISELISSMQGGFTAFEQLNGMMNLDNIASLGDIASSAEVGIAESAAMLKDYLTIVESNKASVEGFETVWNNMAATIDSSIVAFNEALNSMDAYLSVFNSNADAINSNTSTWEEMKEKIAEQVEALKKAAEALEKQANSSSGSKKPSSSTSSKDDDDGGGVYISAGGNSYHESTGTAAEIIGTHGTDKEKESYRKYRENLIDAKREKEGEGWYEAAMKQLDEELEKAGIPKYHTGIEKGFVQSSNSSFERFIKSIAIDPVKSDEVIAKLQAGEGVFTQPQMANLVNNSMIMGKMYDQTTGAYKASSGTSVDFSIGEIHLHEVQNVDEFAKAMKQTFASSMRQNFSEVFKK